VFLRAIRGQGFVPGQSKGAAAEPSRVRVATWAGEGEAGMSVRRRKRRQRRPVAAGDQIVARPGRGWAGLAREGDGQSVPEL
jgi:hypothetical protein